MGETQSVGTVQGDELVQTLKDHTQEKSKFQTRGMIKMSAVDLVMKKLQDGQKWVTITGNAGEGKTTLGYSVLISEDVFIVDTHKECLTLYKSKKGCTFILNDIFGQLNFDQSSLILWSCTIANVFEDHERITERENPTSIFFISSRNEDFVDGHGTKILAPECVLNLSTSHIKTERVQLLDCYLSKDLSTDSYVKDWIAYMDTPHGFPDCCKMYADVSSRGEDIDIITFFKSPLKFLDETTIVLLTRKEYEEFRDMIKSDGQVNPLKINDDEKRDRISKAASELNGSYIKKMSGHFRFTHPSIQESVVNVIGKTDSLFIVKYPSISVIMRMVNMKDNSVDVEKQANADVLSDQIDIHHVHEILDVLCDRFRDQILKRDFSVLKHKFCENLYVCERLERKSVREGQLSNRQNKEGQPSCDESDLSSPTCKRRTLFQDWSSLFLHPSLMISISLERNRKEEEKNIDILKSDSVLGNEVEDISMTGNPTVDDVSVCKENKNVTWQDGEASEVKRDSNIYRATNSSQEIHRHLQNNFLLVGDAAENSVKVTLDASYIHMKDKSLECGRFDVLYKHRVEFPYRETKHSSAIFDKKELLSFFYCVGYNQEENPSAIEECDSGKNTKKTKDLEDILYEPRLLESQQKLVVAPLVSLRHYFEEVAQGKKHSVSEKMMFEGFRLKSFHKVKISASSIRLAAVGFYATGDEDETKCFSCAVTYRGWRWLDNPLQIHHRISPDCSYITGSDTSNVPIDSTASPSVLSADLMNGGTRESTSLHRNENPFLETQVATSNSYANASTVGSMIHNSSNINNGIAVDSSINQASSASNTHTFSNAVYPHYSDTKARIGSFSTWPLGHCKKPADLVLVGFFYAGYADCVRCFVCGVGLRTWEAGDDPWEEHVRWRSSCDFVRTVKGEEFIAQTLAAMGRASQQTATRVSNGIETTAGVQDRNSVSNILSRDVCRQAIEMGFSTELVRQHATDIVQAQADRTLQLEILLEKLLQDNENSQRETIQQTRAAASEQTTPIITQEPELLKRNSLDICQTEPQQMAPQDDKSYSNNITRVQQPTLNSESSNPPSPRTRFNDSDSEMRHGEQQARNNPAGEDFGDEGYVGSNDMMDDPEDTLALNSMSTMESKSEAKPQTLSHPGSNRPDTVLLTTISEENRELRESNLCKICLDDPANIVFLPCGHLVACAMCTPALERCPVCRSFIRGSVRAHLTSMSSITNHNS